MAGTDEIRITMLGTFSLSRGKNTICESAASKENQSWRMLKYLVANSGKTVSMQELVKELTFSGLESNIENTIRVRLRRVRGILDELGLGDAKSGLVLFGNGKYRINGAYKLTTDAGRVDRLYLSAMDQKADCASALKSCTQAIGLFGGAYLQYSAASPWISLLRDRYAHIFRELIDRAAKLMTETGDFSPAEKLCDGVLRVIPDCLPAHEMLLSALLDAGLVGEAATYYSKIAVALVNTDTALPAFKSVMKV